MKLINRIREELNLLLYGSRNILLGILKLIVILASFFSVGMLLYFYGFEHSRQEGVFLFNFIAGVFFIYCLNVFAKILFAYHPLQFIKKNWLEVTMGLLIISDLFGYYILGFELFHTFFIKMDILNYRPFYVLFVQLYVLILVIMELYTSGRIIHNINIPPVWLFLIYYFILAIIGTLLFLMPEVNITKESMPFKDALFTAISAITLTGMTVFNITTYLSFKGHLLLLFLIEVGAVSFIIFSVLLVLLIRRRLGAKEKSSLQTLVPSETFYDMGVIIRRVIYFFLFFEILGAILLFLFWPNNLQFESFGERIFYSLFHAVAAFCNSGFSLFSDGLQNRLLLDAIPMQLIFIMLLFIGALGYPVSKELFGIKYLRERLKKPWKRWDRSTTIAVYGSIALVILGALALYVLERDTLFAGMKTNKSIITAIFQSVSFRTAGYSTIDISGLTTSGLIIVLSLMFIGGASGSTAGGIKTSTFFIILIGIYTTIRGKETIEFQGRTISNNLISKGVTIFVFAFMLIMLAIILISLLNPHIYINSIVFEVTSAFSNTGLSYGITRILSDTSKHILLICMLAGRVGVLSLAFSMSARHFMAHYKYPKINLMIG